MTFDPIQVAALYKFTPFPDPASLREPLLAACKELTGVQDGAVEDKHGWEMRV
ncbi:hypothetical protein [Qipengyuania sp. ASV99]|uniref:hypothetical protein n=1 Tax=Qipengyuania sp. ASV99 TaxID=3399681 RepID=UPI003A4C624B